MGFITSQTREMLVDWHQHIGSLTGELKVISTSHLWDRFFTKDKWFEKSKGHVAQRGSKGWTGSLVSILRSEPEDKGLSFKKKKLNKQKRHWPKSKYWYYQIWQWKDNQGLFHCFAYIFLRSSSLDKAKTENKRNRDKNYKINRYHFVKFLIFLYEAP